ncbi:YeeE/YedE family protein [Aquiflexum sp. TKW24L]|uniref:YeeE/YedE thiosulfate transporter family protein n=1 Tax=Aquiflexum sp. TKW24L TaxID=2942212 RepID=UPI0020C123F6|nr:YeeE/YedE thiosulfate transporter family protein [Aquiflexum sp. TKW24L]MCL6260922.1 YeeE/YedE family protein [Aquiflexum sp. TKW24L]
METFGSVFTQTLWSPYVVGIGIGILSWLSFLISGKPIATSTTFARAGGMIENLISGGKAEQRPYFKKIKLLINWQWMLVLGVVLGSFLSAMISGDIQANAWVPPLWASAFGDDAVLRVIVALVGGIILGFGARFAGGCTSGHGISGTLQLAVSSWVSVIFFFIGGVITAHIIYYVIA